MNSEEKERVASSEALFLERMSQVVRTGAECFCYAPSVWRVWIATMVASVYAPVCEARLNIEIAW